MVEKCLPRTCVLDLQWGISRKHQKLLLSCIMWYNYEVSSVILWKKVMVFFLLLKTYQFLSMHCNEIMNKFIMYSKSQERGSIFRFTPVNTSPIPNKNTTACITLKGRDWRLSTVNQSRLFKVTRAVLFLFGIECSKRKISMIWEDWWEEPWIFISIFEYELVIFKRK